MLTKLSKPGIVKSEKKDNVIALIKNKIAIPYYDELKKRKLAKILTQNFRRKFFTALKKVRREYQYRLSPKDVLNILILALDDPFLYKIDKRFDINLIFFSKYTTTLLSKYEKNKEIAVVNHNGKEVKKSEFGYFILKKGKKVYVKPENKNAFYYKILEEIRNRLKGENNNIFDKYFDGCSLKKEYKWMVNE